MKFIIYKVTCKTNNKIYIGQTNSSLQCRKKQHIYSALKQDSKYHFHRALRKHGLDNFSWEIIDTCDIKNEVDILEKNYIKKFDSFKTGFNMTSGGGGLISFKHSLQTKVKMSNAQLGNKHYVYGRQGRRLGIKHTEEVKNRIADKVRGNKNRLGKKVLDQDRVKISRKLGGKPIKVFSKENGNFIGIWLTIGLCAEELKLDKRKISLCARGKRKSHGGYTFIYGDL